MLQLMSEMRTGKPVSGGALPGQAGFVTPAMRKWQEKDPDFPAYDGNPDNFVPWLVTVEERRGAHKLQDEVAIAYATHALGSHARGTVDGEVFPDLGAFVSQLKKRFCSDS